MKPIINLDEVEFDDVEDNGRYTASRAVLGSRIGAKKLGDRVGAESTVDYSDRETS